MDINKKNREKYAHYAKLLWDFAYASNTPECRDFISNDVREACFREHYAIQDALNIWKDKWKDIDFESMIKVGDYLHVDKACSNCDTEAFSIYHILDIRPSDREECGLEVVFERLVTLNDSTIMAHGENLEYAYNFNRYNDTLYLKPMCGYILDGFATKTDAAEWDALYEQLAKTANEIKKYNKKHKDYDDGIED